MQDEDAKAYLCVYPFVRSYEWYLLPEEERRAMLAEHGMLARPYPDVRANTVSSFALGDYEWMLAFEADELHRIVDLMRALRAAAARRHTREEVPFYTGRRRDLDDILAPGERCQSPRPRELARRRLRASDSAGMSPIGASAAAVPWAGSVGVAGSRVSETELMQ